MKRLFHNDPGEGTTIAGKLYITAQQRGGILKWLLYSLTFLAVLVLQDVIFSRASVLGGTPCLTPGFILLVGLLEGPNAGGLFALFASAFWALSGIPMGSVSILLLTGGVVLLGAVQLAYLRRGFWQVMACCALGLLLHEGGVFFAGVFMKYTTFSRWGSFAVTFVCGFLCCPALYPLARAIGRIGGDTWTE